MILLCVLLFVEKHWHCLGFELKFRVMVIVFCVMLFVHVSWNYAVIVLQRTDDCVINVVIRYCGCDITSYVGQKWTPVIDWKLLKSFRSARRKSHSKRSCLTYLENDTKYETKCFGNIVFRVKLFSISCVHSQMR